jgi:clan AA aspartic protease (TIGR02281 family)
MGSKELGYGKVDFLILKGNMKTKIFIFTLFFLASFILEAKADTVYLKNGRSIKGLIKKETQECVWLDLGIGTIKFGLQEIDRIERSSLEEADRIRQEWQRENILVEKEVGPREVGFSKRGGHIFVNALLNNKVNARLVLDTGAPNVLLSGHITKELGIKTQGLKTRTTAVAGVPDLRVVDAVLDTIKVEGVEAKDIDVALSLEEIPRLDADGLLGMSFLKRFKFQIDSVNKKLILEEKKSQNILEKTRYFSVVVPSDWGSYIDEESLTITGPNLTVKEGPAKPYITIKKYIEEEALGYFGAVKETYDYFKNSADIEDEMSERLKEGYERNFLQDKYEAVSFDFEEKKDFIILHEVFIYKENSTDIKWYRIDIITKDEPLRCYNLNFICPAQHFDTYLPVFKTCLESFVINE